MATAGGPGDLAARRADRRAGSLVTQALGDALGFLVEGHHPTICAKFVSRAFASAYPPSETRGPFSFGQYSDDTQLARELALSFVEARGWDPACFARRIAALFESETIVGRGHATAAAAARLLHCVPWDCAGDALGFLVEESVLYAFYAFRMSPNDPGAVLQTAVSVGGDVDTVAAMAGAMVGAAVGLSGLDTRFEAWSRRLNDQGTFRRHDLVALARDLG